MDGVQAFLDQKKQIFKFHFAWTFWSILVRLEHPHDCVPTVTWQRAASHTPRAASCSPSVLRHLSSQSLRFCFVPSLANFTALCNARYSLVFWKVLYLDMLRSLIRLWTLDFHRLSGQVPEERLEHVRSVRWGERECGLPAEEKVQH